MPLLGKQVRQLRSMAHSLKPIVSIGKGGIGPELVEQAHQALDDHELVKCSVLDASGLDAREAATELADRTGSEVVQVIGRRFSLYRRSRREDFDHIELVR